MPNPNPSPATRFKKGCAGPPKGFRHNPQKKAYKEFLREYLANGEAVRDFRRATQKQPLPCVQEAADRIFGRAPQKIEASFDVRSVQVVHTEKIVKSKSSGELT